VWHYEQVQLVSEFTGIANFMISGLETMIV
jgi:hypothetical protein